METFTRSIRLYFPANATARNRINLDCPFKPTCIRVIGAQALTNSGATFDSNYVWSNLFTTPGSPDGTLLGIRFDGVNAGAMAENNIANRICFVEPNLPQIQSDYIFEVRSIDTDEPVNVPFWLNLKITIEFSRENVAL